MFDFIQRNRVPSPNRFFELSVQHDQLFVDALKEYQDKQRLLQHEYGIDQSATWDYIHHTGKVRLLQMDDILAEADGQIIGTYSKSSQIWEWAWNNPYIEESAMKDSLLVRHFGVNEHIRYLCDGMLPIQEILFANYLLAVSVKLTGAEGIYCGDTGDLLVYIMLKNIASCETA